METDAVLLSGEIKLELVEKDPLLPGAMNPCICFCAYVFMETIHL
jgi:hypothetical protein